MQTEMKFNNRGKNSMNAAKILKANPPKKHKKMTWKQALKKASK